ncbi:MAG: hypothetical protein R3E42_00825 [Burkholderiaceae bacterium]
MKLFSASAEKFSNLVYEQADSLQPAADELKLQVQTFKGSPAAGADAGVLNNPKLIDAVFADEVRQGKHNTEAVSAGSGRLVVAARVTQYQPARTRPLAEVKEGVRALLVARRSAELAVKKARKSLQAWKAGTATPDMPALRSPYPATSPKVSPLRC